MSKEKVEDYEGFTSEDAERILETTQSEDLPENIEELEEAIRESMEDHWRTIREKGEISKESSDWICDLLSHDEKTLKKAFAKVFKTKKIRPIPDWDMDDLVHKIDRRRSLGISNFRTPTSRDDLRPQYETIKNRKPIISLVELAGEVSYDVLMISDRFIKLDSMLKAGKTFYDLISEEVYQDCPWEHVAFLMLVEEKVGSITTPKKLIEGGDLKDMDSDYIEKSFYTSQAYIYGLKIDRTLKNGGKYEDLFKIDLDTFYLPKTWLDIFDNQSNKESKIERKLRSWFAIERRTTPYRELAQSIEAPLSVILKLAREYD